MIHLEMSDSGARPTRIRWQSGPVAREFGRYGDRGADRRLKTYVRSRARVRRALTSAALIMFGAALGACGVSRSVVAPSRPAALAAVRSADASQSGGQWITVRPGETLWSLAERFGPRDQPLGDTVENLIRWNGLNPDASLHVGQRIRVAETTGLK